MTIKKYCGCEKKGKRSQCLCCEGPCTEADKEMFECADKICFSGGKMGIYTYCCQLINCEKIKERDCDDNRNQNKELPES